MGDPKKIRKKYNTPRHPWIKARIDSEKLIRIEFGTRNKKEIWKMETLLKNFKDQAKNLIILRTTQSDVETKHLFRRVKELGLISGEVTFDEILGLSLENIMGRRLQTIVYKKGLARTVKQARQFIVHEHILVAGKKITSPAYLVPVSEESSIEFSVKSSLFSEDHPERALPEKEEIENSKKKKNVEKDSKKENSKELKGTIKADPEVEENLEELNDIEIIGEEI